MPVSSAKYLTSKELFQAINASEAQQNIFEEVLSTPNHTCSSLYERQEGIWIFAFQTYLTYKCVKSHSWEEQWMLIDLYIRIEEWILEDLYFLPSFPEEVQPAVISKAKNMLQEAYCQQEALRLIKTEEEEEFVNDLLLKLKTSGKRTYDREKKILQLLALYAYSPKIFTSLTITFIQSFKLITELSIVEPALFVQKIDSRLEKEENRLNTQLQTGELTPELCQKAENMIRLAGTEFLIARRFDQTIPLLRRVMFYHYLCVMDKQHPETLKNIALNTLLCANHRPLEFSWEEITSFSIPRLGEKVAYFNAGPQENNDSPKGIFQSQGQIILNNKTLTLQPRSEKFVPRHLSGFLSCLDGAIHIRTHYKAKINMETCQNLTVAMQHWDAVLKEFQYNPRQSFYFAKEYPPVGAELKIRITKYNPAYPLIVFAQIEDDTYKGYGTLHIREITKIQLPSIEGLFVEGDIMTARVIETDGERFRFSIKQELCDFVSRRYESGEHLYACLINVNENRLLWASEYGFPVYTTLQPEQKFQIGDCYELQLTYVNKNGYVRAQVLEQADVEVDILRSVSRLINHYIDNNRPTEEKEEEDAEGIILEEALPEEEEVNEETKAAASMELSWKYVKKIVYILDLYANSNTNYITKFNLLCTARLICRICKDYLLEEFYTYRISYMCELYHFITKSDFDPSLLSAGIEKFPRLTKAQTILNLLAAGNDPSRLSELTAYIEADQKQIAFLSRLILSRHLLNPIHPEICRKLDTEILTTLAFSTEDPDEQAGKEEINFGRENNTREFKTTIVFPPSQCYADQDRQMDNIIRTICGFLNAEGGTLFIGVNDAGFPQGIETDLKYLQCNEDKYQLIIRYYICKYLGKDINGLINIGFHSYNDKTVCSIVVPVYHIPVVFKEVVWQRQGNATCPLDHNAIKLLKERKKIIKMSFKAAPVTFPDTGGEEIVLPDLKSDQPIKIAEKPQAAVAAIKKHTIPTTLLPYETEGEPVAYFTILTSNQYLLTDSYPYDKDERLILPIYANQQEGQLIQVYDNAYVNRISVSTILEKKRNYEYTNALYSDANIIFMAIAFENDGLYVKTKLKKEEYICLHPLQNIKLNIDLSLKGTPLFAVPFDHLLQVDIIDAKHCPELENILHTTDTVLGSASSSLSVLKEVVYLQELFLVTAEE